jgi:hypothetical protein
MPAALLLGLTLALAPTSQTTRLEVSATGEAGYLSADFSDPGRVVPRASITGGAAWGRVTLFFDDIIDDDAAPSLQPFLQRAGQLTLSGSGGGWTTKYGAGYEPVTNSGGGAGIDASGYFGPGRAVYGGLGLRVDYNTTHYGSTNEDTSRLAIPIWIGVGFRWRDLRVRATWQVASQREGNGDFHVPFWGNVGAHVYGVVRRRLELDAELFVLEKGAAADGSAELWLARRVGIALAVNGGHETPSTTQRTQDFFGGLVALDWWLTARFALNVSYRPEWRQYTGNDDPRTSEVDHLVTLGIIGRPL